jgi:hypothetical protein
MRKTINLEKLDGGKHAAEHYANALLENAAIRIVKELQRRAFEQHEEMLRDVIGGADHLKPDVQVCQNRCTRLYDAIRALKSAFDTKPQQT